MKDNTKRIVAREGLVILGIIGVGFLMLFLSTFYPPMPKTKDIYRNLSQQEKDSINGIMSFRKKYPEYDDLDNLLLAEKLSKKYPEYLPIYEGMKSIHEKNKSGNKFDISTAKPGDLLDKEKSFYLDGVSVVPTSFVIKEIRIEACRNNIAKFGGFTVIFGYPIYLLILFIVWAVRTLRLNPSRKE